MPKKPKIDTAEIERIAELRGRIAGIQFAGSTMSQAAGDDFDRAFANRVNMELNRQLVDLQRQVATPRPTKVKGAPMACPIKETGPSCYRRDGDAAVINIELQGKLCKGCERRVSTLDGWPE